ncbi:MAG: hypothetical protein ACODAD_05415 [Planctomycetota bacterium]
MRLHRLGKPGKRFGFLISRASRPRGSSVLQLRRGTRSPPPAPRATIHFARRATREIIQQREIVASISRHAGVVRMGLVDGLLDLIERLERKVRTAQEQFECDLSGS